MSTAATEAAPRGFALNGKAALVTGAGRGIGAQIARTLAAAGARVMVTDVDQRSAAATAAAIVEAGGTARSAVQNVTQEPAWEEVVAEAVSELGGLDILVNNAGIESMSFVADTSLDDFRRIMAVNVEGVFLGIKHAVRTMRPGGLAGRGGSIVNLSSVAGLVGSPGLSAYCASKGAVRLLTKAAAVECGALKLGIRVNSVHPGIVRTDMGTSVIAGMAKLGLVPDVATAEGLVQMMHPIGTCEPIDVAQAVLFLASDASRKTTGAELLVDGGMAAQ
jgi:NAD(P)-dependent dehydrogenase (short-subunit alcohol dehydrogenase family)